LVSKNSRARKARLFGAITNARRAAIEQALVRRPEAMTYWITTEILVLSLVLDPVPMLLCK